MEQLMRELGHDSQSLRADRAQLLAALPTTGESSTRPLQILHDLLKEESGPWPVFALVKCLTRVYKHLPEDVKTGKDATSALLLRETSGLVKASYSSLAQFIAPENKPALRASSGGDVISHRELHDFVTDFTLPVDTGRKPVVSIAVPNGPLLAATCIAVTTYYTASPINPAAGPEQFRADIVQARADFILTTHEEYEKLQLNASWVSENGIRVFVVDWIAGKGLSVKTLNGDAISAGSDRVANKADDISLILFTSGTSGTKKVVPLTTHSIVTGVVAVIESWGLTSEDICLNMMPLYHV